MALNNVPTRYMFESMNDTASSDMTLNSPGTDVVPVDSSSGAVTVTLGDELQIDNTVVKIVDVAGSAGTNNITIDAGTVTINGDATGLLDANNESVELVYLDATGEWHVTNRYGGGGLL